MSQDILKNLEAVRIWYNQIIMHIRITMMHLKLGKMSLAVNASLDQVLTQRMVLTRII